MRNFLWLVTVLIFSQNIIANIKDAQTAAATSSVCKAIMPFYWEIGTGNKVLASGSESRLGIRKITEKTEFNIASASKFVFAAYVLQREPNPSARTVEALTMRTGYTSFNASKCILSRDVHACFTAGSNNEYNASHEGRFSYGGGHFQLWAEQNGLGSMTNKNLTQEFKNKLGVEMEFSSPQMAGGLKTTAKTYREFLQKMLNKQMVLVSHLGSNKVCTNPDTCPTAVFTPAPKQKWSYSLGHWVEEGSSYDDGVFSSPGAFGFYPWINQNKTHYGIISRHQMSASAAGDSSDCGRVIRKAFFK